MIQCWLLIVRSASENGEWNANGTWKKKTEGTDGVRLKELEYLGFLGVDLPSDRWIEGYWKLSVGEDTKVPGTLKNVWKKSKVASEAKVGMCNNAEEPSALYDSDTCKIHVELEKKADMFEMSWLRKR